MKSNFAKIASIFFLTILFASNIVNLHVYAHDEAVEICHHDDGCGNDSNDKESPCDICLIAFNLNSLDYNYVPEFSFVNSTELQQITPKKIFNYVEGIHTQFYINKNRNKAPPYLA